MNIKVPLINNGNGLWDPTPYTTDFEKHQKNVRERALGMLQGGMRTADVTRAINCNVRTVRCLRQHYRETGRTADRPSSGKPRVTPAPDRYIRTSHLRDRYR